MSATRIERDSLGELPVPADALYGVTVGDDSVSRVISLRLDEATALAEHSGEPAGARAS